MSYKGKSSAIQGSKPATPKPKAPVEPSQPLPDDNDFSRKFQKHYKYDDMFSRVNAEVHIHSNLSSVVSKLNNEGTLEELHLSLKKIIENEVSYTLNVLNFLKSKRKNTEEDFDLKEQLFNNIYIFKENFKSTLAILVDDLWNSHLCNPKVLSRLLIEQPKEPKENGSDKAKVKANNATPKQSNIFPIKEATDEEEFETPQVKQRSHASYRQSQKADQDENPEPESLTDRHTNHFQHKVTDDNDDDEEATSSRKRDSKSVDHTRGSYSKKSDDAAKRGAKQSPLPGGQPKKGMNLDIFSQAGGGKAMKKKQPGGGLFGK